MYPPTEVVGHPFPGRSGVAEYFRRAMHLAANSRGPLDDGTAWGARCPVLAAQIRWGAPMLSPFIPPHPEWCRDRGPSPLVACADIGPDGTVHALHHFGEAEGFGAIDADGSPAVYLGRSDVPGQLGAVVVHLEAAKRWGLGGMTAAEARQLAAELLAAAEVAGGGAPQAGLRAV